MGFGELFELADNVVIFDDRPGKQLRKEQDVGEILREIAGGTGQPAIDVHKIGDLFEDDEGNADRQYDRGKRELRLMQRLQ